MQATCKRQSNAGAENGAKMRKTMQGTGNNAEGRKQCEGVQKIMQRSGKAMQNTENEVKCAKRGKAGYKIKTKGWVTCIGVAASQRSDKTREKASETKSAF